MNVIEQHGVEIVLGNLLRWGTIVSGVVIAAGGGIYMARHGDATPHYAAFAGGEPSELRSVSGIIAEARTLDPRGIIQLGMLLLIATPIARVIGALVAFAWQRDLTYAVISAIVLTALLYGLLVS